MGIDKGILSHHPSTIVLFYTSLLIVILHYHLCSQHMKIVWMTIHALIFKSSYLCLCHSTKIWDSFLLIYACKAAKYLLLEMPDAYQLIPIRLTNLSKQRKLRRSTFHHLQRRYLPMHVSSLLYLSEKSCFLFLCPLISPLPCFILASCLGWQWICWLTCLQRSFKSWFNSCKPQQVLCGQ